MVPPVVVEVAVVATVAPPVVAVVDNVPMLPCVVEFEADMVLNCCGCAYCGIADEETVVPYFVSVVEASIFAPDVDVGVSVPAVMVVVKGRDVPSNLERHKLC